MHDYPHAVGQMMTEAASHLLQSRVAAKHDEIRAVFARSDLQGPEPSGFENFEEWLCPILPPARSPHLRSDLATTSALASEA